MSYAICRLQKIGGAKDIAGIQLHNRRERNHSNSNPDIDRTLSKNNYVLKDCSNSSYNALVEKRLQEGYKGKRAIRKDAVKLCEVLFTSDNDFFSKMTLQQQREYFEKCYQWAENQFGTKNIIAATIHMDETTPHMHVDFVPLTDDGRLSAKEVIGGRKDLQEIQDNFYTIVGEHYGLERGKRIDIDNPEDKTSKHLTTKEYKQQQTQQLKKIEKSIEGAEKRLDSLKGRIMQQSEVNALKGKKSLTGALKGVSYEEYLSLKRTASHVNEVKKENKDLKNENESLKAERDKALESQKAYFSMKKLKEANKQTDSINKNRLLCKVLGVPENATYDQTRKHLQKQGLVQSKNKEKEL